MKLQKTESSHSTDTSKSIDSPRGIEERTVVIQKKKIKSVGLKITGFIIMVCVLVDFCFQSYLSRLVFLESLVNKFVKNDLKLMKVIEKMVFDQNSKIDHFAPDTRSKFISSYELNSPHAKYIQQTPRWTQLCSSQRIPFNQTYRTKFSVSFSNNNHILFGITNRNRIQQQSSFFSKDTYCYYGNNGCIWGQGKILLKDQIGFKEKQVIQMQVQLWRGLIQWLVNGQVRGQVYSQNLKKQQKQFVFYLEMFEKDDQVIFLQQ